jgi:hypothetical protein
MGKEKIFRPVFPAYGQAETRQSLTGASTGTTITRSGVTTIALTTGDSTSAALGFSMADPEVVGMEKTVMIYVTGASTQDITIQTGSNLYGTTGMTVTIDSTATATQGRPQVLKFLGMSTAVWALTNYPSTSAIVTFGT